MKAIKKKIREERIKRTQDIAENAAAEIRDSNEVIYSYHHDLKN